MLQKIKDIIYEKYQPDNKIGLFFSTFDKNDILLSSNGVVSTDKTLEELINLLYNGIIKSHESNIEHIIISIIKKIEPQTNIAKFLTMDPKTNGVILSEVNGNKTGVILPNMKGIDSMQQAIACIKVKYQLEGDVNISTFTVDELTLHKN